MKLHCDVQQPLCRSTAMLSGLRAFGDFKRPGPWCKSIMSDLFVFEREWAPKSRMHHVTCSVSNTASGKAVILSASFFSTATLLKLCIQCTYSQVRVLPPQSITGRFTGLNWICPHARSYLYCWQHLLQLACFLKPAHNRANLRDCPTNHRGRTTPSGSNVLSSLALPSHFTANGLSVLFATNPSISSPLPTIQHKEEKLFPCAIFWYCSLLFPFLSSAHLSPVLWHRLKKK